MATANEIQQLYVAYFNRPADKLGLQFWLDKANATSIAAVAAGFSQSDEYHAQYPDEDPIQQVRAIYNNLFGRDPEPEGLLYWAGKLTAKTETFGSIALTIANSAQNADKVAIDSKIAAAAAFTTSLTTTAEIAGYSGDKANAVARTWLSKVVDATTLASAIAPAALDAVAADAAAARDGEVNVPTSHTLTTGVDAGGAFTGGAGADAFIGNASTLSALDQLDGGAGTDSLTVFGVDKDGAPAPVDLSLPTSIKNIETLTVTATASKLVNDAADVSAWTGLTSARFDVKGGAVQTITAADTTAVTVNNTDGGVTVNGGSSATVASGATAVAKGGAAAAGLAAAATAAATAATAAATAKTTADNLKTATDTAAAAAVAAEAGDGGSNDLAAIETAFNGTVGVSAADKTTVSTAKAAVGQTDAGLLAVINDIKTANAAAATAAATAKTAADNAKTAADAALTNNHAGAIKITGTGGLTTAKTVGGTTVDITDDGEDSLTSVSADGHTGLATLTGDKLTSVTLANTSAAANIVNATVKHTLNLTVNAVTGAAAITDAAATTVNLTATGAKSTTKSDINLTTNVADTLNITTGAALTLTTTALAAADKLETVTVAGAGSLSADFSGVASLTSLDMTAGTGKHTVKVDGTVAEAVIKGGSGVDDLTTVGALDAKSTVDLGAGNDVYRFDTAAAAGALVAGGDGTDALAVKDGSLINSAAAKVYSGFEVLEVAGGQGSYDMSILGLTDVTLTGTALAAAATIANAAAGTTLGITATAKTNLTTGQNLTYALKDATGSADAMTVTLTAIDGNDNGVANGIVTVTKLIAASIETVNVVSAASTVDADDEDTTEDDESLTAADYTNTISTLTADKAKTVVFTGEASVKVSALQSDALTKIDATGASGDVTVTAVQDASGGAAKNAVSYLGGSGVDTYTASGKGDIIAGNAGADVITLAGGKDTVALTVATDSVLTLTDKTGDGKADAMSGFDSISSFASGANDVLDLSGLHLATGSTRGAITLHTATADTAVALETAIGTGTGFFNDGVANRGLSLVTAGANSYLFIDANGDGNYTAGADAVIKLVGITSIVLGDVAFG
ncbi:DUF4214 domain-containing protein [Massilia endophytica]|uniref:DUF4214 domain-containing protein n=1 Tax=Massilia endophytica TaxID=2899220 RepID=UPI001E5A5D79|nr:DUF4214 domain-containing protein [Massilia endophytica]UGQ45474.1 DUF4214 domain-containing protein [Massilia endophytica]